MIYHLISFVVPETTVDWFNDAQKSANRNMLTGSETFLKAKTNYLKKMKSIIIKNNVLLLFV